MASTTATTPTQQTQQTAVLLPPGLKITITGETATGKTTLAHYLATLLKLHGHDVAILEKFQGEKVRLLPSLDSAAKFKDARAIRIEVKDAEAKK